METLETLRWHALKKVTEPSSLFAMPRSMLGIAFTLLCLTVAEHSECSDSSCAVKGQDLLQRQKRLKIETLSRTDVELMSFEEFEARVKDSYASAQQKLQKRQQRGLRVEQSFDSFEQAAYRAFRKDESCSENVENAVDHFVNHIELHVELNSSELDALKARVLDEMEVFCKHHHIENITDPQEQVATFKQDFMVVLADEQPVLTEKLFEFMKAEAEGNFSMNFAPWLLNFSMLDLRARTGRAHDDNVSHSLLLTQTQSYTEKMKRRALPPTFDSRSHWPHCAEVVGRIHNQGTCGGSENQVPTRDSKNRNARAALGSCDCSETEAAAGLLRL